ncbi:hypothetical protein HJFPF1_12189 [Paramyrothecium foliicola]|nr:hypothetical protein HJFPF1_12189 [Paramyrothecium foliicola]
MDLSLDFPDPTIPDSGAQNIHQKNWNLMFDPPDPITPDSSAQNICLPTWEEICPAVHLALDRVHFIGVAIRKESAEKLDHAIATFLTVDDMVFRSDITSLVHHRFPAARKGLCQQLGDSIAVRRRMLLRSNHTQKCLPSDFTNRIAHPQQTLIASALTKASGPDPQVPVLGQLQLPKPSALATVTTTISKPQDDLFGYPPLPPASEGKARFQCPLCLLPLARKKSEEENNDIWMSHIDQHLKPDACMFPECIGSMVFFVHRNEWKDHLEAVHSKDWLRKVHTITWYCDIDHDPIETFETESQWRNHMQDLANHPKLKRAAPSRAQLDALSPRKKEIALRGNEPRERGPVLLYDVVVDHVTDHLKTLSLMAVPSFESATQKTSEPMEGIARRLMVQLKHLVLVGFQIKPSPETLPMEVEDLPESTQMLAPIQTKMITHAANSKNVDDFDDFDPNQPSLQDGAGFRYKYGHAISVNGVRLHLHLTLFSIPSGHLFATGSMKLSTNFLALAASMPASIVVHARQTQDIHIVLERSTEHSHAATTVWNSEKTEVIAKSCSSSLASGPFEKLPIAFNVTEIGSGEFSVGKTAYTITRLEGDYNIDCDRVQSPTELVVDCRVSVPLEVDLAPLDKRSLKECFPEGPLEVTSALEVLAGKVEVETFDLVVLNETHVDTAAESGKHDKRQGCGWPTTDLVGNGNPHQNPWQVQLSIPMQCPGHIGCEVSHIHSRSFSVGFSANAQSGWFSGGFAVQSSIETGNQHTCYGSPNDYFAVWKSQGTTAYTMQHGWYNECWNRWEPRGGPFIMWSSNQLHRRSHFYCVYGGNVRNLGDRWLDTRPHNPGPP